MALPYFMRLPLKYRKMFDTHVLLPSSVAKTLLTLLIQLKIKKKKKIRPEGSAFRYYRNNIPFADRIHHHGIFFYKFFLYRRQSMEWTNLIESIEFLSMLTFLISIDVIIFI